MSILGYLSMVHVPTVTLPAQGYAVTPHEGVYAQNTIAVFQKTKSTVSVSYFKIKFRPGLESVAMLLLRTLRPTREIAIADVSA